MKKIYLFLSCAILVSTLSAQVTGHKSFIQQQAEFYSKFHFTKQYQWDSLDVVLHPIMSNRKSSPKKTTGCTLNKRVFGWMPYWTTTTQENDLNLSLLSDIAYGEYDVDVSTGNYSSIHSWTSDALITKALSSGVKVELMAQILTGSDITTFLSSATTENTFITTIINVVNARKANGVNIDFEEGPSSDETAMTAFMERLCDSVHSRVPGGQVTVAAPAFLSGSPWNVSALSAYVDLWVIMGYDYYWGSAPKAGPNSPLTSAGLWSDGDCTSSVVTYLASGCPNNKLALGVPYYGYDWPTSSAGVNVSTTATGSAVLYNTAVANAVTYGRKWDNYSMTPYYTYGSYHECWYDDNISLGYKYNMVNVENIAGIGIWALGYDDGLTTAWDAIQNYFTSCEDVTCSGEFTDLGDTGNYHNSENWTWTLAPTAATGVSMSFSNFNTTAGDILSIYNGSSTASPLIGNYQGTSSPGVVTGTTGTLTFHFSSSASGATASGWKADWVCSGPGSCGPPIGLSATSVTTNSATLNWIAVSGATSYNVQYKTTSASTWTTTATSSTSLPIAGLTPNTSYEFQVQAVCSSTGNYSSSVNFMTECIMKYASLPYSTSFENLWLTDSCDTGAQRSPDIYWRNSIGGTTPNGNDYWHRDDYTGTDWTNPTNGAYTPTASAGTYSARFHNDPPPAGSTGALDLYLDMSVSGTKTISFDYIHNEASPSPFAFNVLLSTDGGNTFPTTLTTITSAQMSSWTTETFTTTATSATSVVRFIVTDKGTQDVGIDNLNITNTPTGIEQLNNEVNLNAYPNPFSKSVTVDYTLTRNEQVTINLIDIFGRTIPVHNSENEDSGQHKLNIDFGSLGLAKGLYIIQLQTSSGNSYFKVISQ